MKSQTEAAKSGSSPAPCSALTPETLNDILKDMAQPPRAQGNHFLSLLAMSALEHEVSPPPETPPIVSTLFGLPMFAMPNQQSDCIVINDKKIAEAYKDGVISEKLLLSIIEQNR